MYKVLHAFTDLQDNNYGYAEGDIFPHNGFEPLASRYEELSGKSNRRGISLIEEIADEVKAETVEKPKRRARK